MKELVHLIISFSMLFTTSLVTADTQPVNLSSTGTNSCSVILNQDLTFSIPNAIYDAGPFIGKTAFKLDFTFFGEQNGQLFWQFADVGSPPSSPTCSVSIEPDLSFTLEDAVYNAGPSAGEIAFQAEFKYSGEQNGVLLWYLADIKVDNGPTDPTPDPPSITCGAYIAPNVWKEFDCYNLAAIGKTTNDDPFTPSWRLTGGYWQWGRKGPDPSQWHNTNTEHFAHGPTGPGSGKANSGDISGWDQTDVPDGAWSDSVKTANDPCLDEFRVPTRTQWEGVLDNNNLSTVGTWSSYLGDPVNYSAAWFFGSELMLPAAGRRAYGSGALGYRGYFGDYWSSSGYNGSDAWYLYLNSGYADTHYDSYRWYGHSVRCVAE